MSDFPDFAQSKQINEQEHVHAAGAKRVVPRFLNPNTGEYQNVVPDLVAGVDYDYIDVQQTSSSVDTFVFKTGGGSGSTVQSIKITYTDSTKADMDKIEWL